MSHHPAIMLLAPDIAFAALAALLGLLVGSFLNVVIHRLPKMMHAQWAAQSAEFEGRTLPPQAPYNLWQPPSQCPVCGTRVAALHNIPVLSYLMLRGRCAHCAARISPRYPI
ncbi:MAG TPA: prepilin peptidase, partial [Burkholderiaceae bacterium]|nr:prepilin peptidase [Burkholderiaceae bacterium]